MPANLADREGTFRAEILDYGVKKFESESVAIGLHVKLTELYSFENKEWHPWAEYGQEAYGDVWVIKKDGTTNDRAAESLMRNAGWDGSLLTIAEGTWRPTPCQVVLKKEEYKGNVSYKVAFVNAFDAVPGSGAMGNVDDDGVKALEARYGSAFRALQGNVARNKPAAGKPSAPPKPPKAEPAMAGAGKGNGDSGIPF